ncbi:MAG: DNA repair protein RecO [Bifidobacteriaceae bacterium]|jgi:DNA repair protein RecO (recombination protein O)|nr:DNA repair protein RecO [Bifidobacteriaceae bacterium]
MATFTDDAIILKTHKLSESDKIVTCFTKNHGKVKAVARGARRTNSSYGAKTDNFTEIKATFAKGKSLDIITQSKINKSYFETISAVYDKFISISLICNFTDQVISELYIKEKEVFFLLQKFIKCIAENHHEEIATDIYLLQFLKLQGYEMNTQNLQNALMDFYYADDMESILKYDESAHKKITLDINSFISELAI